MILESLTEPTLKKREILKEQLNQTLKEVIRSSQKNILDNNLTEYHNTKEKFSIMLDIWRQANNPDTCDLYIQKYLELLFVLIDDISKNVEMFSIPRKSTGEYIQLNLGLVQLLEMNRNMYKESSDEETIWDRIIHYRKENKPVIDVIEDQYLIPCQTDLEAPLWHIFMTVKAIVFTSTNKTQIRFSLFDRKKDRFITDTFFVELEPPSEVVNLTSELKAVFRNIPNISKDIFFVSRIFKVDDKMRVFPFGTFCVPLFELRELKEGKIFTPFPKDSKVYAHSKQSEFINMHKLIINDSKTIAKAKNTKSLIVSFFSYRGNFDELMNDNDKNLKEYPIVNCIDVVLSERTDMRITLLSGKFTQESIKYITNGKVKQLNKKNAKNVQIKVTLLDNESNQIKNCFYTSLDKSTTAQSSYVSFIYVHENKPEYNDWFYINAPENVLYKSILMIKYKHVSLSSSEKNVLFGFSYLPLGNPAKQTVIIDGQKELTVFCASNLVDTNDIKNRVLLQRKELFYISTNYNSTMYTQNSTLNKILHLNNDKTEILKAIEGFSDIPIPVFVKCLKQTYDSLLTLLSEHNLNISEKVVVFKFLVDMTDQILKDKNLKSQEQNKINFFIENQLNNAHVHSAICELLKFCLFSSSDMDDNSKIKLIENLKYIFKFMLFSEKIQSSSTLSSVDQIIECIVDYVKKPGDEKLMICLLYNLPSTLIQLKNVYPDKTVIDTFFEIIHETELNQPKSYEFQETKYKLLFEVASNFHFSDCDENMILNSKIIKNLQMFNREKRSEKEEIYRIAILKRMLSNMYSYEESKIEEIMVFVEIVPSIVYSLENPKKFMYIMEKELISLEKSVGIQNMEEELMICLWQIMLGCFVNHFDFWEVVKRFHKEETVAFAEKLFNVCIKSMKNYIFDQHWLTIKLVQINCYAEMLLNSKNFFDDLTASSYSKCDIIGKIIELYIILILDPIFLHCESETKNDYIQKNLKIGKNVLFDSLISFCDKIGETLLEFHRFIIENLYLINLGERGNSVKCYELFYMLMKKEYEKNKNLKMIESESIRLLHRSSMKEKTENVSKNIFDLIEKKVDTTDKGFKIEFKKFFDTIRSISTYISQILTNDNNRDKDNKEKALEYIQTDIFLKLLKTLEEKKSLDKTVYFTYFYNFVSVHVHYENWVEAGLTQLKYIDMIDWDNLNHYSEKENENIGILNKDEMYEKAMEYFDKAKDWERCIDMCSRLEEYYNNINFHKTEEILLKKAKYYNLIGASKKRFYPYYYRVVFLGAFEEELKMSEWVYRSKELEQLTMFMNRIIRSYPNTSLVMLSDITPEITGSTEKKYINITNLSVKKRKDSRSADRKKEDKSNYYENNDIDEFFFNTLVQKGEKKSFKTLWTKRVNLKTEIKFPSIQRKTRVVEKTEEMISPIESAIEVIHESTEKLNSVINNVSSTEDAKMDLGVLSINLQGMIDAAVSGGTKVYIDEFFKSEPKYVEQYPEEEPKIGEFLRALTEQQELLRKGLDILKENNGNEALHKYLLEKFEDTEKNNDLLFSQMNKL